MKARTSTPKNLAESADDISGSDATTGIVFDTNAAPIASLMRSHKLKAAGGKEKPGRDSRRSDRTCEQYAYRVRALYRASERRRTVDPENPVVVSPIEVARDLIESAAHPDSPRSPASYALYRSALLWHLATHRATDDAYEQAYKLLAAAKKKRAEGTARKGPKKTIPARDLKLLLETLIGMRQLSAQWGGRVQLWLLAGVATGVRVKRAFHGKRSCGLDHARSQ